MLDGDLIFVAMSAHIISMKLCIWRNGSLPEPNPKPYAIVYLDPLR